MGHPGQTRHQLRSSEQLHRSAVPQGVRGLTAEPLSNRHTRRDLIRLTSTALAGAFLPCLSARAQSPASGARRKLLALGEEKGYRHEAVSHALVTVERLGRQSGLWDTYIRTDTEPLTKKKLEYNAPNLNDFDAVLFYTGGTLEMTDQQKADLISFIHDDGKGFIGVHSATITFTGWPEYGEMIGGYFDEHPWGTFNAPIIVEDPSFPGMQHWPHSLVLRDEIYQMRNYSRDKLRVLMRLDADKLDLTNRNVHRGDRDFAVAWAKTYGKGRVFYSTLGHPIENWDRSDIQEMYSGAIRWALGLVDADVTPRPLNASGKLNIGIGTYSYHGLSMDDMMAQLTALQIREIEMSRGEFMLLSHPNDELFRSARAKLDAAGIRCVSYYAATIRLDTELADAIRFAKLLGAQNITGDATGDILKRIDEQCTRAGLTFGIHNHYFKQRFAYESPDDVLRALAGLSPTVGATLDIGHIASCGYDTVDAVRRLASRLKMVHLKDVAAAGGEENVLLGHGIAKIPAVIEELRRIQYRGLIAIEYEKEGPVKEDLRRDVEYARKLA